MRTNSSLPAHELCTKERRPSQSGELSTGTYIGSRVCRYLESTLQSNTECCPSGCSSPRRAPQCGQCRSKTRVVCPAAHCCSPCFQSCAQADPGLLPTALTSADISIAEANGAHRCLRCHSTQIQMRLHAQLGLTLCLHASVFEPAFRGASVKCAHQAGTRCVRMGEGGSTSAHPTYKGDGRQRECRSICRSMFCERKGDFISDTGGELCPHPAMPSPGSPVLAAVATVVASTCTV